MWEKSRGRILQHLDAHQLLSVPLTQDVRGFRQVGQKVTISLVYQGLEPTLCETLPMANMRLS